MFDLKGTPTEIGKAYGKKYRIGILENLEELVHRVGHPPLPRNEAGFQDWVRRQEKLLKQHWPWLLEEMAGVAEGCGQRYEDVLLLNLRAWQYDFYGRPPVGGCSSLAVTLADGTKVSAGALDDPAKYYCGPIRFAPENGYRFITFPITGTSWGNRGMNSQGLATGISSQVLPGLKSLPNAVNQDLALRVILQTCTTVDDVRAFCQTFPFTMNLVCVDAQGDLFAAHHTAAGLFEISTPEDWCALTNHISDDAIVHQLSNLGVRKISESKTTRPRREKLVDFCRKKNNACTIQEVMDLISKRDDCDLCSIHNSGSLSLTFAIPQVASHTLWVMQPTESSGETMIFEPLDC